jgi:hypothetical protein
MICFPSSGSFEDGVLDKVGHTLLFGLFVTRPGIKDDAAMGYR